MSHSARLRTRRGIGFGRSSWPWRVYCGVGWWIRGEIRQALRQDLAGELCRCSKPMDESSENWIPPNKSSPRPGPHTPTSPSDGTAGDDQRGLAGFEPSRRASASGRVSTAIGHAEVFEAAAWPGRRKHFQPLGTCLAHTHRDMVGAPVAPFGGEYLREVVLGKTIFVKPTKEKLFVVGFDPNQDDGPVIGIAAPIRDQHGVVIGGLGLAFPLGGEYTRSLALTRTGTSGETFAFDRDYLMLSSPDESRKRTLVEKGLLAKLSSARLNVQVRVPRKVRHPIHRQGSTTNTNGDRSSGERWRLQFRRLSKLRRQPSDWRVKVARRS